MEKFFSLVSVQKYQPHQAQYRVLLIPINNKSKCPWIVWPLIGPWWSGGGGGGEGEGLGKTLLLNAATHFQEFRVLVQITGSITLWSTEYDNGKFTKKVSSPYYLLCGIFWNIMNLCSLWIDALITFSYSLLLTFVPGILLDVANGENRGNCLSSAIMWYDHKKFLPFPTFSFSFSFLIFLFFVSFFFLLSLPIFNERRKNLPCDSSARLVPPSDWEHGWSYLRYVS